MKKDYSDMEAINSAFKQANKDFINKKYKQAIEKYKIAIKNNNEFYPYYENLSLAYKSIDGFQGAIQNVRRSLCLNPVSLRSTDILKKINQELLKDSSRPLLTIVVPVHNTEKYLDKCIESILNQTIKDFELIIVNDGSIDGSLEIIKNYMKDDSRIKLINNEKASGNPGTPRNQAIEIAKGHYLGFVDSDDWIDNNMYKTLVEKAVQENSDIVFSGGFKNFKDGKIDERKYDNRYFNDTKSKYFKFHESFMIWDKIFRTDVIKTFSIKLGETRAAVDVPFIFKAYYYMHNVAFCSDLIAYNYRRESDTSVTVNFRKGSDCNFEIEAYHGVEFWAKKENINNNFKDLIRIKKLTSYIYTLKVIAPEMFEQFFEKAQKEISAIDEAIIDEFSIVAKKRYVFKAYQDICNLSAHEYRIKNRDEKFEPTFKVDGLKKGILVFPEWTYSNAYQKLLYRALNEKYNINVRGFKPEFFTENILRQNRDKCDYIHLHWLNVFMDLSKENGCDEVFKTIKIAKKMGYKIIYTAHNIISHDTEHRDREISFRKKLIKEFDYILAHGEFAKIKLINEVSADLKKIYIIEHGVYGDYYPNTISKDEARKKFDLKEDDFVFLFLGNIKGYKGIEPLLNAFNNVRNEYPNAKLIIAGKVADEKSKALLEKAVKKNPSLIYKPGFVKDIEVQIYFNVSDIMVLPYKQILTSGVALLSVTFNTPILAPNTGLLPELIGEKQGFLFDSYVNMQNTMSRMVASGQSNKVAYEFEHLNNELNWRKLVLKEPFSNLFGGSI